MPRYVLLYHDTSAESPRPPHWDFMLESGDVLRTWALAQLPRAWHTIRARTAELYPNCPALASDNEVAAEGLADHRIAYLEYEGAISNNRGHVRRVAAGTYEMLTDTPTDFQIALSANGEDKTDAVRFYRASADATQWRLEVP